MKKLSLFLVLLFLTACENIHFEEKDFEDFIQVIQEEYDSGENVENTENKNKSIWVKNNFPKHCDWLQLERIVDGDTIIVKDGRKRIRVRMIGIDTPESKKEGTKIQPHAIEASDKLKKYLKSEKQVCLLFDEKGDKYDKYARRLSYVFTKDGKDLNAEMLKVGLAKGYFYFSFARKSEFRKYEKLAKKQKLGIWE